MATIRKANEMDIEHIIVLGYELHQNSLHSKLEYSVEKVARLLFDALTNDDALLLVAEKNGEIIGGFFGFVTEQWYSYDKVAGDYSLFIHPDHRGGMTAARLITKYKQWAHEKGAISASLGITTGIQVEQTSKLYEHLAFKKIGALFEFTPGVNRGR